MYDFYALLDRMKYIKRWSLMRSTQEENIMQHSQQVAMLAHALTMIEKYTFQNSKIQLEKVLLYALYHESSEVLTGDLPTPIKYFNTELQTAYKNLEQLANNKLLQMLPKEWLPEMQEILTINGECIEGKIVKWADKLSAYIKCLEEKKSGNVEFQQAEESILKELQALQRPSVDYFLKYFIPAYSKSLDEIETLPSK